jgi:hypothetical protein
MKPITAKARRAHEEAVAFSRCIAAFVDGPDDEGLTTATVAKAKTPTTLKQMSKVIVTEV